MVFLRLVGFCINLLLILLKILAPCRVPCIPAWTPQGKLLWPSTCQHAFASQWFQEHRFLGYSRLKLPLSTVQDASQKNEAFTHLIHLIVVYLYIIMLLKLCCVYVYIYIYIQYIYIYAVYIYTVPFAQMSFHVWRAKTLRWSWFWCGGVDSTCWCTNRYPYIVLMEEVWPTSWY